MPLKPIPLRYSFVIETGLKRKREFVIADDGTHLALDWLIFAEKPGRSSHMTTAVRFLIL
jgi:hypothetical protein